MTLGSGEYLDIGDGICVVFAKGKDFAEFKARSSEQDGIKAE
jgi:hypothetical protein